MPYQNRKLNMKDYKVEAAAGGGFYAYCINDLLCSAYGETPDEAYDNLILAMEDMMCDMYMVEEYL